MLYPNRLASSQSNGLEPFPKWIEPFPLLYAESASAFAPAPTARIYADQSLQLGTQLGNALADLGSGGCIGERIPNRGMFAVWLNMPRFHSLRFDYGTLMEPTAERESTF